MDVRRERRLPLRLTFETYEPATPAEGFDELDGPKPLAGPQASGRADERFPGPSHALLDERHLHGAARRTPDAQPARDDARVVDDDELPGDEVRELRERSVLDLTGREAVDEQARGVPRLRRALRDQLRRELVVEVRRVHRT
jgi:hypothetical protein